MKTNRTALITGAAKRIGKSMAVYLASRGWNIAIHYNLSKPDANKLRDELQQRYPNQQFEIFKTDLNWAQDVETLITQVSAIFPKIDLLINNASVFEPGKLEMTTVELLENQINVNFKAPLILIRDFAQTFGSGSIINFADTRITTNHSNYAAYTLSKKALWELTKMAATEFGPYIRVNAIAPGLSLPPEEKNDDYLWKLADKIPMKKPGGVDPILKSIDYIIDNEYLTGQILYCDGGENLI